MLQKKRIPSPVMFMTMLHESVPDAVAPNGAVLVLGHYANSKRGELFFKQKNPLTKFLSLS